MLRRRGYPAKLIAHIRNQDDLGRILAPWREDIFYVPDSLWHRAAWEVGRRVPSQLGDLIAGTLLNFVNERFQAGIIRDLIAAGQVDLIHQPAPVSPLAPSAIHGFGVPVVIGPMNGGMNYPPGFDDLESHAARRIVSFGRTIARFTNWIVPGKRKATALLVANERTRASLPFSDHPNVIDLVENGVDLATWSSAERKPRPPNAPFRLIFMGRLIAWKAVDTTLQALAAVRAAGTPVTLDILGDGPERERLEALAGQPGLAGAVHFHGFLAQAECAAHLATADALILNSVRECGGAVILEAMSLGLPVIGSDWGGPADYLDPSCGILVSPVPRADFSSRLGAAIMCLASNPDLCQRMGAAGAQKVRTSYNWESKVDRIIEVYEEALTKKALAQVAPSRTKPGWRTSNGSSAQDSSGSRVSSR
ncbi:glycosyltransferase family 4 protein [Devosia submarina]|uniref:glycosyltransferase family 4 protein n=1 Tax=Devosia submarina TaxID=1173082 RepID=UPI00130094AB|nr:glycosyltransferase family 4 protein [Devosia submarina]